jgi:tetratricopeptide (TPR) repeat protein
VSASRTVSLTDLPVPRLCFELLRNRFSGTMELPQTGGGSADGMRTVWWRGGMPVFTDWVSPPDVLGEVLMASRVLDQTALFAGLQTMATEGGLLGSILVGQGTITTEVLSDSLREQCRRKLLHVFGETEGEVVLTPLAELGLPAELSGQVNVLRLVLRGVRRHYDPQRASRELGEALQGTLTTIDEFERYRDHFAFTEDERALIAKLQSGVSGASLDESADKAMLQVLTVLWHCGMLAIGTTAEDRLEARGAGAPAPPVAKRDSDVPPPPPSGVDPSAPPPQMVSQPPESTPPEHPPPPPSSMPPLSESGRTTPGREKKRRERVTMDGEAPSAAELDEAGREFVARLEALEASVAEEANAFALMGLELDAGRKDVRAVWATLSAEFHPDTLSGRGLVHLLGRVEDAFAALSEAYSVLSNKESRENLAAVLKAGGTGKPGGDAGQVVRNALEADLLARDGNKLLKAKNYARAVAVFREAHDLSPDDPEISACLTYCEFCVAEDPLAVSSVMVDALRVLVDDVPNCARAHYFLGMILKRCDAPEGVVKEAFRGALKADHEFVEAQRELRAIELNRRQTAEAAPKKKKGLKGFFGR